MQMEEGKSPRVVARSIEWLFELNFEVEFASFLRYLLCPELVLWHSLTRLCARGVLKENEIQSAAGLGMEPKILSKNGRARHKFRP